MAALHFACAVGSYECVNLLLHNVAFVDAINVDLCTPLYFTILHGHEECLALLLQNGANVNNSSRENMTPLFDAAY